MRIGIKMNACWRNEPAWRDIVGHFSQFLRQVRQLGIESVEFSVLNHLELPAADAHREVEAIAADADTVLRAGLRCHLHPYVHRSTLGPLGLDGAHHAEVLDIMDRLIALGAGIARRQDDPVNMILHPAEDLSPLPEAPAAAAEKRTAVYRASEAYLRRFDARVRQTNAPLRVFCEQVPAPSRGIRIGDRVPEVLALIRDTRIGICWDTGHYAISAERLGFSPIPEAAFLDRVGHVHLHAYRPGHGDHHPPAEGDAYLERCREILNARRFDGVVTLEYRYAQADKTDMQTLLHTIREGWEWIRKTSR